ncbi:outer membrane beta-barrel protein [Kordiimonas laminariae]|uniref:outer membrane beta-barrel protein n=1 Tax=Kordiimonas laminariae TaxID=2917717 RepID=UPI001FF20732|nr:hypothetical protein [Kordiimonas laminariae]MCK0070279.1 hypothetical protein [Kordiimonas laminariae]
MKYATLLNSLSTATLIFGALSLMPTAHADDAPKLSYTFIEGGYLTTRNGLSGSVQDGDTAINFISADTDGFFGRLSYQFGDNMYVWGDFSQNKYELAASTQTGDVFTNAFYSLKPRQYMGGLGIFHELDDNFHLFAEGGIAVTDFSLKLAGVNTGPTGDLLNVVNLASSNTEIHGTAKAGLRYMSEFGLELNLAGSWTGNSRIKANDAGNDFRIADEYAGEAGLRYHFNDKISLGASYRRTSENTFLGSVRFSF